VGTDEKPRRRRGEHPLHKERQGRGFEHVTCAPETSLDPSGAKATERTLPRWPRRMAMTAPRLRASRMMISWSLPPDADRHGRRKEEVLIDVRCVHRRDGG